MEAYTIQRNGGACEVRLTGDLTAAVVPGLQSALRQALPADVREVAFDLGAAAMLDSSGIGLLIATCNSLASRKGKVRVLGVSPEIHQLLQSMRLVTRLNVTARA